MCTCGHPKGGHVGGLNACRFNGCACQRFREPGSDAPPETGPRRVSIDVPDGYMLSISLVPYTETQELEKADEPVADPEQPDGA